MRKCNIPRGAALANLALLRLVEGGSRPEDGWQIRELVGEGDVIIVVEAAVECVDWGGGRQVAEGV
jgi:hypothetical protein